MSILSAHIVPHPPLIVPAVGKGKEKEIQATIDGYKKTAEIIHGQRPDTIVMITPHSVMYSDYIHISPGNVAKGSFEDFGVPGEKISVRYDTELVGKICEIAKRKGIPAGTEGERNKKLDHGTMVPLYFINQLYNDYGLVRVSISGLPDEVHYLLGVCIQEAAEKLGRRVAVIGSGDLSHKLKEDGPYGFSPAGPEFDKSVTAIMKTADFESFLGFNYEMREEAAECGLRSFIVTSGVLDRLAVETDFVSYEGTFGVGYAVCNYHVLEKDLSRNILERYAAKGKEKLRIIKDNEDPYVSLARLSLETYIGKGRKAQVPGNLPVEMVEGSAGVFVSLKKDGILRGCIGTIAATKESIADEIIENAISAGTRDPRFPPVTEEELDKLVYSVDVLLPPEPADISGLDPMKYGVIVSRGHKRGLLLPDLEGVDTVEKQLDIALQKGGISVSQDYKIERFEVVRHK